MTSQSLRPAAAAGVAPAERRLRTRAPLVARGWRAPAVALIAFGVTLVTVGGILLHGRTATRPDLRIHSWLVGRIEPSIAAPMIHVTDPAVMVVLLAIVVVAALLRRRADLALLAAAGPGMAVPLASFALKPLIGRHIDTSQLTGIPGLPTLTGAFPSGHETAATATAWVLVIACCQLPMRRAWRWSAAGVLALWVLLAAVALVRDAYHYASDTAGGFGVGTAVVLTLALGIDRFRSRRDVKQP